jgi:hypothetical protein
VSEQWLPAPGYEGRYEVSSLGRIRSLPRTEFTSRGHRRAIRGGILKPAHTAEGYLHVSLRHDGKLRLVRLHRLVCEAFHGPGNALHNEVAHLDGNRANARADNLKWVSKAENQAHRLIHGTHCRGEQHASARLTDDQARWIKSQRDRLTRREIATALGIKLDTVRDVQDGRRYAHVSSRPSTIAGEPR